jgi:L-arabonate dehydrase
MAEVGNMALPAKVLKKGIDDMIRISDARMSGTAYGTVVLHVSPEAAIGGPINFVSDGDLISIDVEKRLISVDLSDEEMERRRSKFSPPKPPSGGGYTRLFYDSIEGPELGADFQFLKGCRGAAVPKHAH